MTTPKVGPLETDASCVSGNYFMGIRASTERRGFAQKISGRRNRNHEARRFTEGSEEETLNRSKQRIFEQKETKLTKVRQLPSARLFFRKRSAPEPWLTARLQAAAAVHKRAQHLRQSSSKNSDLQPLRTSTLLTLLPSVQFSLLTSVPRRYRGHRRFLVREIIAFVLYRSA